MAVEKQIVWRGLLEAQNELEIIDRQHIPAFIDRFDVHHQSFAEAFGNRALLINTIGSFVLSQGSSEFLREPGERKYIADDASVLVYVPKEPEALRTILISIDAEAVTQPSTEPEVFEPLFQRVTIPVRMVKKISELRAA